MRKRRKNWRGEGEQLSWRELRRLVPVEIGGGQKVSERAELEALRGEARRVHEIG